MKKALVVVLVLSCLLLLVGCDPAQGYLHKDELIANTVRIDLVEYKNESPRILNLRWGKQKPSFDLNNATFIATLDEAYFEAFLDEITAYAYHNYSNALNEPMGKTVILYQENGNMIVLFGCPYTNEQGETWYYGDCYIFDESGVFAEYIGKVGYLFGDQVASEYFGYNP